MGVLPEQCLMLPLSISAQKTPETVTKAFAAKFLTVKKVSYDHEKNGNYEAEFALNGVKMSADFKSTGKRHGTRQRSPALRKYAKRR